MVNRDKTIMIMGAARGQVGLYKAAKKLGYRTIAVGIEGPYPGLKLADEAVYVDLTDKEAVLKAARANNIDAIVTACHDLGIETLGYVCDQLGLKGLSYDSALLCNNKVEQKRVLVQKGIPVARSYVVESMCDAKQAVLDLGIPLVIKRIVSQGSSGVFVSARYEEAMNEIEEILSMDGECLVEEYLEGEEFGAQAFIYEGKVLFVAPHGDLLVQGSAPMPIGHYYGEEGLRDIHDEAYSIVSAAAGALGLDNCAVNADLMLTQEGMKLIEISGRAGSNGLPELTGALFGIDYYEQILRAALGELEDVFQNEKDGVFFVRLFGTKKRQRIRHFYDGDEDQAISAGIFLEEDSYSTPFQTLSDCVGMVLVKGSSIEKCKQVVLETIKHRFALESANLV